MAENYGVIANCTFSGDVDPYIKTSHEPPLYHGHLLDGYGLVCIGDAENRGRFTVDIHVDEKNEITLSFHNTAKQLLCSVHFTDPLFYRAAESYREAVKKFFIEGSDPAIGAVIASVNRSAVSLPATEVFMDLLESGRESTTPQPNMKIKFGGPERFDNAKALFYLCAHAIRHSLPKAAAA